MLAVWGTHNCASFAQGTMRKRAGGGVPLGCHSVVTRLPLGCHQVAMILPLLWWGLEKKANAVVDTGGGTREAIEQLSSQIQAGGTPPI